MNITTNSVVKLKYKLYEESGKLIDSSDNNGSLVYIHGFGMMMPGIEKIVEGQIEGFTFSGNIEPEDGYGVYDPKNLFPVPKSQMSHLLDQMEEGKSYQFDIGGGQTKLLKVLKIDDDNITLDANHPYAGETLKLECEVEGVRVATKEEIDSLNSHTHSHSNCGCGGNESDSSCGCGGHDKDDSSCCSSNGAGSCGCNH